MNLNTFTIISILFLFGSTILPAEGQVAKFGDISHDELTMSTYAPDTSAAAVVLYDVGNAYFKGMSYVFERHIRIKILKKAGYKWADFSIPFYHTITGKERVLEIKGSSYNLEGSEIVKTKLNEEDIFDEKSNDYWHQKKITIPNVKVGSVIELSFEVRSNLLYNFREWDFQTTIPVVYSEYKTSIPTVFDYKLNQQGYLSFSEAKKGAGFSSGDPAVTYFFSVKEAPALKPENFITSLQDYQSKLSFEIQGIKDWNGRYHIITGDWKSTTQTLLESENFGKQLKKRYKFKDEIAAIVAKYSSPEEKMNAIHLLLKNNMKWNGGHGFTAGNITKAVDLKKGSAADINLLLTAMLLEAGLDAAPVILSTRANGRIITGYSPMLSKFDYVIAHVNIGGKDFLLDATEPLLPANVLPVRCLNGEGRLIKENDQRWIPLTPDQVSSKLISSEVKVDNKGEITGKGIESTVGYYALDQRKAIKEDGEDKFIQNKAKEVSGFKLGNPVFANTDKLNAPLSIAYNISAGSSGQTNDIIYLHPLLGHGEKENPFKLTERMYPVDFATPIDETYITNITIPANYVVEEMPENVVVTLPDRGGQFTYMLQQEGNQIQVISKVKISKPVFYVEDYTYLKEFYNRLVAKHAEKIVLKKATGI